MRNADSVRKLKAISLIGLLATFLLAILSLALFARTIVVTLVVYFIWNTFFGEISIWASLGVGILYSLFVRKPKRSALKSENTNHMPRDDQGPIIDVEGIPVTEKIKN